MLSKQLEQGAALGGTGKPEPREPGREPAGTGTSQDSIFPCPSQTGSYASGAKIKRRAAGAIARCAQVCAQKLGTANATDQRTTPRPAQRPVRSPAPRPAQRIFSSSCAKKRCARTQHLLHKGLASIQISARARTWGGFERFLWQRELKLIASQQTCVQIC